MKKYLYLVLFSIIFTNCSDSLVYVDNSYHNPNAGISRNIAFSRDSGLYSSSFDLSITSAPGDEIYYSTDGSIPSPEKAGNGFIFKYTGPIKIRDRNGQPNVLATPENSEQFYLYPHDNQVPGGIGDREWAAPVYIPTDDQVPKATVIRAIAVDAEGRKSNVVTKTYFIGNNLANYANHPILSIVSEPEGLVSMDRGIMVRGGPGMRYWFREPYYNFLGRGTEWERTAHLELFEGNTSSRHVPLSTNVGLRIRGGWSRGQGQKSFNIFFREEHGGINNLRNYILIPGAVKADGTPIQTYKSIMLRSGGNQDSEYTKFYDVFLHDLLSDRSFTTQAAVPCIVYLNGEYWGPYNLQERYSDNHTEYKYGVNRNNVISIDSGGIDDGTWQDMELYYFTMMNMRFNDMSIQANYDAFCELFDIENFADYFASHIYFFNEDWPQWNFRMWRTRTIEPGNPYGDTKWRFQMHDSEFSMGIYSSGSVGDAIGKIINGEHKDMDTNRLFRALLANEDFCRLFVNTMLDLYNVNFHPDNFNPKLDHYSNTYRPLMDDYFIRWGRPWETVFQNKTDDARRFLTDVRNLMVNTYLPNYFGGYSGIANIGISRNNLRNVTLSAAGASGASIKINTTTVSLASGAWTGSYYIDNPITVTAIPPSGYIFDGWTVTGGTALTPNAITTTVNITGNTQITANYRR